MGKNILLSLFALLILTNSDLFSRDGIIIKIKARDGRYVHGELLSVRDTALLVDEMNGKWLSDIEVYEESGFNVEDMPQPRGIVLIKHSDIESLAIDQGTNLYSGMIWGGIAGVTVGVIVGMKTGGDRPASTIAASGFAFGLVGAAIGAVVGLITSPEDKPVQPENNSYMQLKPDSRYPEVEPLALRKVE